MKKYLKVNLIIISLIGLILFLAKLLITNVVEKKISNLINNSNSIEYFTNVESVDFKLLDKSITFNNIFIGPRLDINSDSVKQNFKNDSLEKITIASIKISDLHYLDYLSKRNVKIGQVEINNVFIRESNRKKQKSTPKSKTINLDSIYIEKINAFEVDRFDFNNIEYVVVDSITNEQVFHHEPISFNLDGFQLEKVNDKDHVFKFESINKVFKVNEIVLDVSENYKLSIDEISLDTESSDIKIKKLNLKPIGGQHAISRKDKFNNTVFDFEIDQINLYHIDFSKLFKKQGLFIDSIQITNGVFDFYKDNRKPFNKSLHKKLPHQLLKELKMPLNIDLISIEGSTMLVNNYFPHSEAEMNLSIDSIKGLITNMSNLSKNAKTPIKIKMYAKLMKKGDLRSNFTFPMNDQHYNFYFDGTLASTRFIYYDDIIYPALGLKILNGNLDRLSFKAKANNYSSSGTMRMLYHNLEATVYKKESNEKSKFLSWAVSTVLHNSNPVKNKKVRVATMYRKHDIYIGFGGYLWKTLQSGIVNTLSPAGNKTSKKADKIIEKKKRKKEKR